MTSKLKAVLASVLIVGAFSGYVWLLSCSPLARQVSLVAALAMSAGVALVVGVRTVYLNLLWYFERRGGR